MGGPINIFCAKKKNISKHLFNREIHQNNFVNTFDVMCKYKYKLSDFDKNEDLIDINTIANVKNFPYTLCVKSFEKNIFGYYAIEKLFSIIFFCTNVVDWASYLLSQSLNKI